MIYKDLSEYIGRTPVMELIDPLIPFGKRLFLKMECFNPNLSVKDRSALGMVLMAMERGQLFKGGTLIESTSGNMGKSFAMLGATFGFNVIVVVDTKVTRMTLNWYKAFGAKVIRIENFEGFANFNEARMKRVQELVKEYPEAYWPNQFENPDNAEYHRLYTGPEVFETVKEISAGAVVGCVSTGGHMTGIGQWLQNVSPTTSIIACDIVGSCIFGGAYAPYLISGVGLSWRTTNTDPSVYDGVVIGTDAQAISVCHIMARDHGILVGGSAGLAIFASLTSLRLLDISTALAILPDSGVSYLDQFYDQDWLGEHGLTIYTREQLAVELKAATIRSSG